MAIAIIGASGGIGRALCQTLEKANPARPIYAISRSAKVPSGQSIRPLSMDIEDEDSIRAAAAEIKARGYLSAIIIATGMLSDAALNIGPEKSWRDQAFPNFEKVFAVNTFGPALVAKHFLPLLARKERVLFAALSARVGSISDNHLGGWHAYRASKAALNMLIRNYALELGWRNDQSICVSLHPGTVSTDLSSKFVTSRARKVFSPQEAAGYLVTVMNALTPADTGKVFDWQGEEIPF